MPPCGSGRFRCPEELYCVWYTDYGFSYHEVHKVHEGFLKPFVTFVYFVLRKVSLLINQTLEALAPALALHR